MPTNALREIHARIELAFAELGCKIPAVLENDEIIVRDLIIFAEEGMINVLESSKGDTPFLQMDENALDDISASVAIHVCKGVIMRALARNPA